MLEEYLAVNGVLADGPESEATVIAARLAQLSASVDFARELIRITKTLVATFTLLPEAVRLTIAPGKIVCIAGDQITHVLTRTYLHYPTAIEMFAIDGRSYFTRFYDQKAINMARALSAISMPRLKLLQLSDFRSTFASTKATELWVSGKLSTLDYLIQLNIFSGRTFNCASQYPIFPWVLSDYVSSRLVLSSPEAFRDLPRPMGAMNPARLEELRAASQAMAFADCKPYLYSSGPSNPLGLYLWLLRLEPFTTLHIAMQEGKFDHARRQFFSVAKAYDCMLALSNDFHEITPEFCASPEFLVNRIILISAASRTRPTQSGTLFCRRGLPPPWNLSVCTEKHWRATPF
jgi:hypothetical protein